MLRDRVDDRVVGSGLLNPVRKPFFFDQTTNRLELLRIDRSIIKVRRVAGDPRLPLLG